VAPILRARPRLDRAKALTLLSFGGWMTLSNLLLPVMINLADRYAIGALLTVAVVTFYTTPSELVVKMLILPRSWVSVLFPRFAGGFPTDPEATGRLCARSLRLLWLAMFPATLAVIVLAPEFLRLWLGAENGPEYARRAGPIMQWLALGMYVYAPPYVPYSFLQAIGQPRRAALIHLAELPFFLAALWFGITRFGLPGAAWAWIARAAADVVLLLLASRRWMPARSGLSAFVIPYMLGAAALAGLIFAGEPAFRLGLGLVLGLGWLAASWTWVLSAAEKSDLRAALPFR
jgi:O-antigen/teichoic acid export membrane protein